MERDLLTTAQASVSAADIMFLLTDNLTTDQTERDPDLEHWHIVGGHILDHALLSLT